MDMISLNYVVFGILLNLNSLVTLCTYYLQKIIYVLIIHYYL